jgi:transposase-like protein
MVLCPACGSSHVRNDYKPAPLALRIFFVRAFLCDHCNYQFKVFSIAGAPPRSQHPSAGKSAFLNPPTARGVDLTRLKEARLKEARLKDGGTQLESPARQEQPRSGIQHDLRAEITRLQAQEMKDRNHPKGLDQGQRREAAAPSCTHCASTNVKRRRRTIVERMVFSATDHKAFTCLSCGETFSSKVDDEL